jgi:hypothetical protein
MSKPDSNTSRRGFLGQLGQVAAAVPLTVAASAAVGATATPRDRQYPGIHVHKEGSCYCAACIKARYARPVFPLALAAVISGYRAMCAVDDLIHVHDCEQEKCGKGCNLSYHAPHVLSHLERMVDSQAECLYSDDEALNAAYDAYHKKGWHERPPFEADFLDEAVRATHAYFEALKKWADADDCPEEFNLYLDDDIYLAEMFAANLDGCQ